MKARNTNIELLRIIAMFLIVSSHFSFHGYGKIGDGISGMENLFNQFWLKMTFTGNLGTALFMVITGYFLCNSKKLKIERFLSVVIQVFTYSVTLYVLYTLYYGNSVFRPKEVFEAMTPLIHETNWYFSAYVLIYLFHPYLNRLIDNLSRTEHRNLIVTMVVVWGMIPVFLFVKFSRSDFLFFAIMYLVGAYLRKYPEGRLIKHYKPILLVSILLWVFIASMTMWTNLQVRDLASLFYLNGSPLVISLSTSLFLFFLHLKNVRNIAFINAFAGCMGGVYLLHENPYVRSVLYSNIFHLERYMESAYLPLITIGFVLITLFVCAFVEFVRKNIYESIEKLIFKTK